MRAARCAIGRTTRHAYVLADFNGKFVGGCDIVTELDQNGELDPLLKS